ncbi:MAG: ORF6N domain-containing protein [Acidobacteria bacterium]|nr:ORF6N domain-containing protein [Acidobacteriota bacterium]
MLDRDLAALYETPTKVFNQAVKRNLDRFPEDFMFRLTQAETSDLRSQIVTLGTGPGQYSKYAPYAFTEHGVAMLASVLRSRRAVQMNIAIVRVFVKLRELAESDRAVSHRLKEVEQELKRHAQAISAVYDEVKRLGNAPAPPKRRIGFSAGAK